LFQFRRLQTRILVFFLSLLFTLLSIIFYNVDAANIRNARYHINEALELTVETFHATLNTRRERLLEKVRLLSSDFAFKQAFATNDHGTILSALENHQARVGANVMMLLDFENNTVIANTLHPEQTGTRFRHKHLIKTALNSDTGEIASIETINQEVFQLVIVPLFAPQPAAWIVIGFTIGDSFSHQIQQTTKTHVSLARKSLQDISIFASTLSTKIKASLRNNQKIDWSVKNETIPITINSEEYIILLVDLKNSPSSNLIAILQRSMTEAMTPYLSLRTKFIIIFSVSLVLALAGSIAIARSVTRPVQSLMSGANRIREGDYSTPVKIKQKDELGHLSHSINQAMKGLADRKHIRGLLGKVVSPAIAEELLRKEIELGGEEREVTTLFSDVRSFTSFCEKRNPKEILSLLNIYLTRISAVIDQHGGVVDKYIGDAVMALFGAPLKTDQDPENSVLAALAMQSALKELNTEFAHKNQPQLVMGIGINTGKVVVGNMGSETRLNYTVIGDNVNLASRLEGITKIYGVGIIVSESTKLACHSIEFLELDKVRVKGKEQTVTIYQPLGQRIRLSNSDIEMSNLYHQALQHYRQQHWLEAKSRLQGLYQRVPSCMLFQIYLGRIDEFIQHPPPANWDGTTNLETK